MKRQVLIDGYRPGGRDVFLSDRLINNGYQPTSTGTNAPPPPAPKPPTGGSAVPSPKKD